MSLKDFKLYLIDLWASKINYKGRFAFASTEELVDYNKTKERLEIELERRKRIGENMKVFIFAKVLLVCKFWFSST